MHAFSFLRMSPARAACQAPQEMPLYGSGYVLLHAGIWCGYVTTALAGNICSPVLTNCMPDQVLDLWLLDLLTDSRAFAVLELVLKACTIVCCYCTCFVHTFWHALMQTPTSQGGI